jgi:hypothetical protein
MASKSIKKRSAAGEREFGVSIRKKGRNKESQGLTVINLDGWPDVLPKADVICSFASDGDFEQEGELDGVFVLDTQINQGS